MSTHLHSKFLIAAALLGVSLTAFAGTAADDKKAVTPLAAEDFPVHPITGPYWHEDSFVTSDLRFIYAYHHISREVLGGGRASVSAVQLRYAITPSLQFVAYKDGWMDIDAKGYDASGWNDLAAGLKWAFYQNDEKQLHAALGVGYEFASGDDQVLQDDDEVRFWFSVNKGFGKLHLGATVNYFLATDNGDDIFADSNHLSWHLHADYQVNRWFSPVIEVNGYHVLDEGDVVTPFQANDIANIGGNKNEDSITFAAGAEVRPCSAFAIRAAYEFPLTGESDVFGHRWTFSAVVNF